MCVRGHRCGNAYIVGINQIYDVDIDKVNKPFLPVAAGEISKPLAWALVSSRFYIYHVATHCNTLQHTATHCNTQ